MVTLICLMILFQAFQATPLTQTKPQRPAEPDQSLRLKTDLIEIRAVVTDEDGRIVDYLKKEDFEVLENGRAQQLAFFALEKLPPAPTTLAPPTRTETDMKRPRAAYLPKRTILLFVDTLHLSSENLLRAKQTLRKLIEERIEDDDLVAVISSGGPMGLVNQFTHNRRILLYAIEKLRAWGMSRSKFTPYLAYLVANDGNPKGNQGPTSAALEILRAEEGLIGGQNTQATQMDIQLRARGILSEVARWRTASLRTLEMAMDQMAKIPGQRIAFFISDGFSLKDNAGNAHGELDRITSRALRAGVLVYSIHARGLEADVTINEASGKVAISPLVYKYLSDSNKEAQDAINGLGKDTGGDAFFNTNDMGVVIKKALDANSVYYELGYYPSTSKNDTEYRRLLVRVKNHPEYKVRAQKGYLPPNQKKDGEIAKHTPRQRVLDAITAPLPETGIGVTASAYYIERDLDDCQVSIEVFIDGTTLDYGQHQGHDEGHHVIDCEVSSVIFDQTGKSIRVITDKVQGSLTRDRLDEGRKNGYRYLKRLALKPGIYQVCIGVRENGSERIGTANTFVEVPNLGRAKLAVSSIVLTTLGYAAPKNKSPNSDLPELFLPGVRQGTPYFKQGASLAYQLTVYESVARRPEDSGLLIQSELAQGEQTIYRSEWQPVTQRLVRVGKKGFDAGGQINLDVKPGIFELRVTVKDPKSNRSAQQSIVFEVEG
jgi:VWFA-related protein